MANPGTGQSYDLPTGVRLDIENFITTLDPFEVALQGMYGADGLSALAVGEATEVKVEWLEENLLLPKTTLSSQISTTTATTINVATADGLRFQTGDVVQVGSEQMNITGISGGALTVTRGWASTTAATAATGATIIGVGSALAEGSDPPPARMKDRVDVYNYTQIFGPVAITLSATENVVQKYGIPTTEFDHQVMRRLQEQAVTREQAIINGQRYVGTGSVGRSMGGLSYWLSSNVDSSTTTISESAVLTQLTNCFNNGGRPDRFLVGAKQKQTFSQVQSGNIRFGRQENGRGQIVDFYDSDFGRMSIILDRWCLPNQAFIFAREQVELCHLRPFGFEMLAKTGDSIKGQVVGESTLKVRRQLHGAQFNALT